MAVNLDTNTGQHCPFSEDLAKDRKHLLEYVVKSGKTPSEAYCHLMRVAEYSPTMVERCPNRNCLYAVKDKFNQ